VDERAVGPLRMTTLLSVGVGAALVAHGRTADPSASSRFPVSLSGVDEPRAAFLTESRIGGRGLVRRSRKPEFAPNDKLETGALSAASHSSPKTGLEWGTPTLVTGAGAGSLLSVEVGLHSLLVERTAGPSSLG